MFLKFSNSEQPIKVTNDLVELKDNDSGFADRLKLASIDLDPSKYIYLRNYSVHANETHGPNGNWDAMPREELKTRYMTFKGARSTIDHQDLPIAKVGSVLDTYWHDYRKDTETGQALGDCVSNVIALDKKSLEAYRAGLVQDILDGKITDTSMGALVQNTECSVCKNIATDAKDFCHHIAHNKGKLFEVDGIPKRAYEICHGVTFFEDSIILPLAYGGRAGGLGADPLAKLYLMASQDKTSKAYLNLAEKIASQMELTLPDKYKESLSDLVDAFANTIIMLKEGK